MASGCILGECIVCGDFIWEDQNFVGIPLIDARHSSCEKKLLLLEELKALRIENQRLQQRIAELEKEKRTGQLTLF